jgi:cytochrome oxidase assembly protein ShyY1
MTTMVMVVVVVMYVFIKILLELGQKQLKILMEKLQMIIQDGRLASLMMVQLLLLVRI